MSATYRIETSYEPTGPDDFQPWIARVYRLSDDAYVTHAWSDASDAAATRTSEPVTVYVDDQGRDAEAPQSVKVPQHDQSLPGIPRLP